MKTELNLQKAVLSMIVREFDLSIADSMERQKSSRKLYIIQKSGMRLGYGFSWYAHGPYSSELYSDLREVLNHPEYEETKNKIEWDFHEDSWTRIREVNEKFIRPLDNLRKLELTTSMHFMYTIWRKNETPYEMRQFFREKHTNKTLGDDSPITDEELDAGLINACNLIAYADYNNKGEFKS